MDMTYGEMMEKINKRNEAIYQQEEAEEQAFWNYVFALANKFVGAVEGHNKAIEKVADAINNVAKELHSNE